MIPPATPGTPTIHPEWDSSPTPRFALAARPARWLARNGTRFPTTASICWGCPSTTPGCWGPAPGATSHSSNRPAPR
ncbi:hypothetical protein MMMB2_3542 [Mycobacterium marinum MB2]|nr:hypothetical protein MMMB2_3542 [Mycobacterium marinum MB2]